MCPCPTSLRTWEEPTSCEPPASVCSTAGGERLLHRRWSPPMRTTLCIQALLGQPQPFHRPSLHQVLRHNLRGVPRLHIPIPDPFRINHHRWSMLALVQASRLVDPHLRPQTRGLGKLIQLRVQFALPVRTARRPRRTLRPHIMTNKHVALKPRQRHSSRIAIDSSLPCSLFPGPLVPWSLGPYSLFPVFPHPHPPASARIDT